MIGITLTGADERTSVKDLVGLADMGAEIGLLYTWSPDERNRYPRWGWIYDIAAELKHRAAIHVCGNRAREALLQGQLENTIRAVKRVQVNGQIKWQDLAYICDQNSDHIFITQHTPRNANLVDVARHNHALLIDASGGRGILPSEWSRPETDKPVGFAGGLGPHNLEEQLPKIAAVARGDWWIDMEGGLRDDHDWFDVGKAREAVEIWRRFVDESKKP